MVLEVIILGLIVFIIAPIILVCYLDTIFLTSLIIIAVQLVWNIFLMCIGRHPLQNPTMIKPEIGKLPKSVVDRIPLVMYIPPPPGASSDTPIKIPEAAYTYPPEPRRFKFLRYKGKMHVDASKETKQGKKSSMTDPETWEDHWEQDGYPFVILESNRAACAICLLDFEFSGEAFLW
jgi:hypothetical protein